MKHLVILILALCVPGLNAEKSRFIQAAIFYQDSVEKGTPRRDAIVFLSTSVKEIRQWSAWMKKIDGVTSRAKAEQWIAEGERLNQHFKSERLQLVFPNIDRRKEQRYTSGNIVSFRHFVLRGPRKGMIVYSNERGHFKTEVLFVNIPKKAGRTFKAYFSYQNRSSFHINIEAPVIAVLNLRKLAD